MKSSIPVTPASARSNIMRGVKALDTKPEIRLRKLLWKAGYRYRLHGKDLPGTPDIVFSKKKIVVFVHGCFWHHHECQGGRMPQTNVEFWREKLQRNQQRDSENVASLRQRGWKAVVVWECELALGAELLLERLRAELGTSCTGSPKFATHKRRVVTTNHPI